MGFTRKFCFGLGLAAIGFAGVPLASAQSECGSRIALGSVNVVIPKTKTTPESTKTVNLYEQYYVSTLGGTLYCSRVGNNNLSKSNPPKYEDYEDTSIDLSVCQTKCPALATVKKTGADYKTSLFNSGKSGSDPSVDASGFITDKDGKPKNGVRQSLEGVVLNGTSLPAGSQGIFGTSKDGTEVVTLSKPVLDASGKVLYPAGTQLSQADGTVVHDGGAEYTSADGRVVTSKLSDVQDWLDNAKTPEAKAALRDGISVTKYDSSGQPIPGSTTTLGANDQKAADTIVNDPKSGKKIKFDDCQTAYEYAVEHKLPNPDKYKCSTTNGIAKGTEIANQVLTGTGRNLVNQMGANAAQQARNGTLIGDQKAAAQMAKTSSTYETALTLANTAAAFVLGKKANEHKQNLAALNSAKPDAIDQAAYKTAMDQQSTARNAASVAAFKATMTAVQGAAGMMAAKSAQKAAEANARLAQQAQDQLQANSFKYDPNQLAPPASNEYDPNQMAATSGTDSTTASTSSDGSTTGLDDMKLTDGSDSGAGSDAINAPGAGAFKSGATGGPGGGAAGAGAPSAGGGGSSGGPTAAEDPKAAYASEFGTKERYETGGGLTGAGGAKGGAAGGKGGDGAGIDLNGLLAQFLPKGEDESAHRSILDSVAFGGNRNIANEEAPSYLDKNADLFQRIHETMSEKNRRGQLGI